MLIFAAMKPVEHQLFDRTERLVGHEAMERIASARVIIFGVGGVGGWVAESLVRSGVRRLTIVDSDRVEASNVNRQAPATSGTIGVIKVEAMKSRLLDINPQAEVEAIADVYDRAHAASYRLDEYDYVIDAIDSLQCKADLILHATSLPSHVKFFSSMGAALKMDPTQIRVDEFWNAKGCPLARALRQKFKRAKMFPRRKFRVVYSPELLSNRGEGPADDTSGTNHQVASDAADWHAQKVHVNGTVAHTTAIFGFTLAGLVIQDIVARTL